ncbi:type II toxin-antitoxin system PemK/MazF family toxin [Streptomyces odonnellii]|uniref:type II toxin-antitoxin system PemK/MazF family toxin n=1 Tax=Streptomyces odonnellii TaxID=1417980 RepID=UPI000A9A6F3C|nr:type II toxin-antitoxin system PemK/MazF family toxin [Streptomyces odonnellii]
MIRGAVYRVDLGDAKRGHEQRGRRYGLVMSPSSMPWSVATIVPTSTSAQAAVFRPELEIAGSLTRLLVDQIRTVDVAFIHGDPVHFLDRDELAEVEHAISHYLGL